jgi:threonine dehydratase
VVITIGWTVAGGPPGHIVENMTSSVLLPSETDVHTAAERIAGFVRRTPIMRAEVDGRPLVLKLEHLQRTGSFKLRGALNAMLSGQRPERVIAVSGGNHGLGVATAAQALDVPATIYVPEAVPAVKARRITDTGAALVRFPSLADAFHAADALAEADPGVRYVHPYRDPEVIAGQGTVALEAFADAPDADTVVVAVGGGGLAAGALLGSGDRPVIAVEPELCPCLHDALLAGHPVESGVRSVAASALGANRVGETNLELLRSPRVRSELVTDEQLLAARDRLWEEFRLAVEPGAAVPFAAFLAGRVPGDLPCLIVCGANTDWLPA